MNHKILLPFLLIVVIFAACTDVKEDIAVNQSMGVHPPDYGVFNKPNNHAADLRNSLWDLNQCKSCHAADYSGGPTGVSCYSCHTYSERLVDQLNPSRTVVLRDRNVMEYRRAGTLVFGLGNDATGPGDLSIGARYAAYTSKDKRTRLVLGGLVELPTGDDFAPFGNGGTDFALTAAGSHEIGRWVLAGQVSGVLPADVYEDFAIETDPTFSGAFGLAWRVTPKVVLGASFGYYNSPLSGTGTKELEDSLSELALAVTIDLDEGWLLQVGAIENLVVAPGADISLTLRVVHRP